MNKIQIIVFRASGKYYTSTNWLEVPSNIMFFHDEFEEFVRNNCGVSYESSFNYNLVVVDNDENDGFYTTMFKAKEMN